jgi:hypothetical protein
MAEIYYGVLTKLTDLVGFARLNIYRDYLCGMLMFI